MEMARLCLTTQTYLKSKLQTFMHKGMTTLLHCCKLAISADCSVCMQELNKDPGIVSLSQNFSF